MMNQAPKDKSVGAALVLTFLFGPLGLFYVTVAGALVMLVGAIVVFFLTLGVGDLFVWAGCMIWGALAASDAHTKHQAWLAQRVGGSPLAPPLTGSPGRRDHQPSLPTPAPPAPSLPTPSPQGSTIHELERLAKLRADGVLTEEEFQAQKMRILGQG